MIAARRMAILAAIVGLAWPGIALAQGASPDEEIVFLAGTTKDLGTVNPFLAFESTEFEVLDLSYDLLMGFSPEDLSPIPSLATTWTRSEDGLTWTIDVRDDVSWHDGEPFTARDVVFTLNFIADNGFGNFIGYLPFTDGFEMVDDDTLLWKTTRPTIAPEIPPYVYILPEHIWGDFDKKDATDFANHPGMIGTGPFELTDWEEGRSWTLKANPDYWGGAPKIDTYVVRKYDSEEDMVRALRDGEIDYIGDLSIAGFGSIQGVEGISTHVGPETSFAGLSFPMCDPSSPDASEYCRSTGTTGHPALLDHDVRLAIAHAIDKQEIVDQVLHGLGSPGTMVIPPYSSRWRSAPAQPIAFDPAEAARILNQAGYTDTDDDGVREMPGGGDDLDFRLVLRSESDESAATGDIIARRLAAIGLETRVEFVTDAELTRLYLSNDFDLYVWGWDVGPDPGDQLAIYTSSGCGNLSDTCYSNPAYDALFEAQEAVGTVEERAAIVGEMQQIIYEDIPKVVLYNSNELEAYDEAEWGGLEENAVPKPNGSLWGQYGRRSALTLLPRALAGAGGEAVDSGLSTAAWVAIVGAVAALTAAVGIFVLVSAAGPARPGRSEDGT